MHRWGAGAFILLSLAGAFVLPTVLIGVVSIKFDEASTTIEKRQLHQSTLEETILKTQVSTLSILFCDTERFHGTRQASLQGSPLDKSVVKQVFDALDAKADHALDLQEMSPFLHYAFDKLFNVRHTRSFRGRLPHLSDILFSLKVILTSNDVETLFHLFDIHREGTLKIDEFIYCVVVIKQVRAHASPPSHL